MADDLDIRREQLKDLLERAELEVRAARERIDSMGPYELAEVRGAAAGLEAFFDKNGSCLAEPFNDVAFFDKNGSCSSSELRKFDPTAFFDKNGSCSASESTRSRKA